MKNWQRLTLVVAAVVCASVVALSANSWVTNFQIRGGNWNGGWGKAGERMGDFGKRVQVWFWIGE